MFLVQISVQMHTLAFKWIRILYRCWQARTPYDELTYLEALRRLGSPLLDQLGTMAETTWRNNSGREAELGSMIES